MSQFLNFDTLVDDGAFFKFINNAAYSDFKKLSPAEKILLTPHSKSRFIVITAIKNSVPKPFRANGVLAYKSNSTSFYKTSPNENNPRYNRGVFFLELSTPYWSKAVAIKVSTAEFLTGTIQEYLDVLQ